MAEIIMASAIGLIFVVSGIIYILKLKSEYKTYDKEG